MDVIKKDLGGNAEVVLYQPDSSIRIEVLTHQCLRTGSG